MRKDFCREASLMADLNHPNVLSLLGVSLQHPSWCMIFEIGPYLDVCELLSARRSIESHEAPQSVLSDFEKLHIIGQVAVGMEYLSDNRFVHRDLAARNVLVLDDQLTCKITDLGLARDCYAIDYHRLHPQSLMLPIRWMPIDAIIHGKFTIESDVWSFGVFMWEVWSGGLRPYGCYTNQEVVDLIATRQLLPCPMKCPLAIYQFISEGCWAERTKQRLTFRGCVQHIENWKHSGVLTETDESGHPTAQVRMTRNVSPGEEERPGDYLPPCTDLRLGVNQQNQLLFNTTHMPMENAEVFQVPLAGAIWLDHAAASNPMHGTHLSENEAAPSK